MKNKKLSLALSSALLAGCSLPTNAELTKDFDVDGSARFYDTVVSVCNDATYLGKETVASFPGYIYKPSIDHVGRKSTFIEGEPIEVIIAPVGVRPVLTTSDRPVRMELYRNGEVDLNRRHLVEKGNLSHLIVSYSGLTEGNYSATCYAGLNSVLGKIDFQVIPKPQVK